MRISSPGAALLLWLTLAAGLEPLLAQDPPAADEAGGSSQQAEESDEEFRRRMELEDARTRDLGFPSPAASPQTEFEKIDKLPEKSRDNIRDQLIDVIVENGEWEPFDALREYPYVPTAAAEADPDLLQKEQEAWDEQIQKYHEREAAAFGAKRGPVPGPGNPSGQEGGGQEEAEPAGLAAGQQAGERAGEQGDEQGSAQGRGQGETSGGQAGSVGTYQPYESNRNPAQDEVSTAGTQQSALDFLRGQQGQAQPPAQASAGASESASQAETEAAAEAKPEVSLDTRGLIPIEDLDKLEGAEVAAEPDESE